jgi:hypothetical protein
MRALLVHWPHIVPVLLAFGGVVYLWAANRRWRAEGSQGREHGVNSAVQSDVAPTSARMPREASIERVARRSQAMPTRAPVRREAARRGVLVLGPILAAISTGAVIYGMDLASARPGGGLVWIHVGFSLLVCLLALYKLAEINQAQVRRMWRSGGVLEAVGSVLLAVLLIPLLLSGIVVLASPSSVSYPAYVHLIASAWWTLLVVWHLMRYLVRSARTMRSSRS